MWIQRLLLKHSLYIFKDLYLLFCFLTVCLPALGMSHFTVIVHIWQWCIILPPHLWGSWNCVVSKQFWADSPGITVLSEIECITLSLQNIYCFQLCLPLLLKSTAVETFIQAVSEDLFLYKTVNRTDTAVIVFSQLSVYSAVCPVWWLMLMSLCFIAGIFQRKWWRLVVGPMLICTLAFVISTVLLLLCNCSFTGSLKSFINILYTKWLITLSWK